MPPSKARRAAHAAAILSNPPGQRLFPVRKPYGQEAVPAAMGRFARSWDLTKTSLRVVRSNKSLLWMPILSGIASIAVLLLVSGVGAALGIVPDATTASGGLKPLAML